MCPRADRPARPSGWRGSAARPADADAIEAEVTRIRDAWVEAAVAGDAATVACTELVVGSDVLSDMGTFTQTFRTPDGQAQTVSGRYIVVLRRQADGSWKIVQHLPSVPQAAAADTM